MNEVIQVGSMVVYLKGDRRVVKVGRVKKILRNGRATVEFGGVASRTAARTHILLANLCTIDDWNSRVGNAARKVAATL